jgi:hypothetical protein
VDGLCDEWRMHNMESSVSPRCDNYARSNWVGFAFGYVYIVVLCWMI